MSVLIKGMDMPRSCDECPCSHIDKDWDIYCMIVLDETVMDSRPSWCPMVEVDEAYFSHRPQQNIYTKLP